MNRVLAIYQSPKEPQDKLQDMCLLIKIIAENYGNFYWDEEKLKFYYYDQESIHMQKIMNRSSSGIIIVQEKSAHYVDPVVSALEKEYLDKRIIQSALYKINLLPNDLKKIFVLRYLFKESVEKIKEKLRISNKRYYQLLNSAKEAMIEMWGFDLKE